MKTNLELWISNLERTNMKLITLDNKDNTYLFKTQKVYEPLGTNNWNYSYSDAMYHVWHNDKWGYTGNNYKEAIKIYENRVKENE